VSGGSPSAPPGSAARSGRAVERPPEPGATMLGDVDLAQSELLEISDALAQLDAVNPMRISGRVREVTGLVLRAVVPGIRVGELVRIDGGGGRVDAEVVGFRDDDVVLVPFGDPHGIGPGALVSPLGRALAVRVGHALPGRILDGLGVPIDGGPPLESGCEDWAVDRLAPPPLQRSRVTRPLPLGLRVVDGLVTLGEGQRMGVFGAPGVGTSTLLGTAARQGEADLNVIALIGTRGGEVAEFLESALGAEGRRRSVVVVATSEAPARTRVAAAFVATAIAEWFRDQGRRVLLMVDSLTRVAWAQRELGLAAGEPPVRQGFPPSVFALLPRLLERAGGNARGSVTGLYAVSTNEGDEAVVEGARAALDGQLVLTEALAARGHFPAVDVLLSRSRPMPALIDGEHLAAARKLRQTLASHARDLAREAFLRQAPDERTPFEETRRRLLALAAG